MILYRPVGLQELALIYDSGMKAFPARLPQQPIFYPVLELEYARQTASDWNAQHGQLAGYVTQFKVEDDYINKFEKHTVGGSQHQELWIPAEEIEEFNQHILGHIKVVEAHFADGFQGFVPEQFALQGKNAVEQFTLLSNSYIYKRMDFYLEIKRNHKAVFLNYSFWQKHDFKNPGLKEKVIKAIKEAWLTSFPQIPLPLPPPLPEGTPPVKQTDPHAKHLVEPVQEDITRIEQPDLDSSFDPVEEEFTFEEEPDAGANSPVRPVHEESKPLKQIHAQAWGKPIDDDTTLKEQPDAHEDSWEDSVDEEITPEEQSHSPVSVNPVREEAPLPAQTDSHFVQGIKLGLSKAFREATGELSRAVAEDPDHAAAHTSLGVAFHRLGEDDRALACYENALKIDPIYAEAHYFRANILYSQGDAREAIAGYTLALGLKPELIEAHQKPVPQDRLTDYTGSPAEMYRIAKPARRILNLDQVLESNPRQANRLKERAAAYYRLRNYTKAIADYTSALAIRPEDASALHSRGLAYEQLGQHDHAVEDYQRAIAINPQLSNIYIDRGVALGNMGNFRQSIDSLTDAIRLAPQNPDSYFNRGVAYFQLGDLQSAMEDFSNVIRLSPGDEESYYWRGMSHEQAGHHNEAIADYRQFLVISQNPRAKEEIEQKLRRWNEEKRSSVSSPTVAPADRQQTTQLISGEADQGPGLYGLIAALGGRALHSTWFGTGVDCYGERADELHALTDQEQPIEGANLLSIASGIQQTIQGDFQAFDQGAASPWIFLRAWEGNGFYIETNDPKIKQHLKSRFPSVEEVQGASPPYVGLFLRI